MSKLKIRALLYQLACFATLFLLIQFLVMRFTMIHGIWASFTAFAVGTILSPKFHAARTRDGEKLFMSWLFVKGVREVG